mgnify:CR=1 FL=1
MSRYRQQDNLLGQANSFLEVLEQISQIAPLDKPVLVIGERGTGKELIAARLHFLSKRWDQNYIKLNCAALNESLLESELFGYEAGAFTGASKRREGRFEVAHNGTLFLDELANTSGLIQEKLLRVVEYGEFERVGGSKSVKTDVRLIAATNEDLPALADAGEFRADLLDRLSFEVITLPPLRVREGDIGVLADYFGRRMAAELGWEGWPGFAPHVAEQLEKYDWPGNVRELRNIVERILIMAPGDEAEPIRTEGIPSEIATTPGAGTVTADSSEFMGLPLREAREIFEREYLIAQVARFGGNISRTAEFVGMERSALHRKLKSLGVQSEERIRAAND